MNWNPIRKGKSFFLISSSLNRHHLAVKIPSGMEVRENLRVGCASVERRQNLAASLIR